MTNECYRDRILTSLHVGARCRGGATVDTNGESLAEQAFHAVAVPWRTRTFSELTSEIVLDWFERHVASAPSPGSEACLVQAHVASMPGLTFQSDPFVEFTGYRRAYGSWVTRKGKFELGDVLLVPDAGAARRWAAVLGQECVYSLADGSEVPTRGAVPRDWSKCSMRALVMSVQGWGRERTPVREELCRRLQRIATRHVRRRAAGRGLVRQDVEDVVQDVLIRLDAAAFRYDPTRSRPETYFWMVADGNARDRLARRGGRLVTGLDADALADERSPCDEGLDEMLGEVPPRGRRVLKLYRNGHTTAEIAEALGTSPDCVRQSRCRGLNELRRRFGEH